MGLALTCVPVCRLPQGESQAIVPIRREIATDHTFICALLLWSAVRAQWHANRGLLQKPAQGVAKAKNQHRDCTHLSAHRL